MFATVSRTTLVSELTALTRNTSGQVVSRIVARPYINKGVKSASTLRRVTPVAAVGSYFDEPTPANPWAVEAEEIREPAPLNAAELEAYSRVYAESEAASSLYAVA